MLLKYRVPTERVGVYLESPLALQDAHRALGLVRFHAAEWHIDPHKIGVIGFSAGGHMVAAVSTHFDKRSYPEVDAADKESCRPDFAVALYPGHLWSSDRKIFELNPNVPVTSQTPPTFLLQAEDDPVDNVNNSLVYYVALKKAGVPVEMHLYAQGGHGFGLRRTKLPITDWPQLVETWLETIGMIMAVHLSPPPALKPIRPFDDNDPEPRWGKENAEHFAKLLHEFYRVTHAKKFFAAHRQMYQLAETRFAAKLTDFDLDWYQKFYGEMPKGRFNLILGNGITAAGTMVLT